MSTITSTTHTKADAVAVPYGEKHGKGHKAKASIAKRPAAADRKYNHAYAIHSQSKVSPLSAGADPAPNFLGFRNLMILMLIGSNIRLMIENIRKYGVLVCVSCHNWGTQDLELGGILYFSVPCHLFFAYLIELVAAQRAKSALGNRKRSEQKQGVEAHERELKRDFEWSWRLIATAHLVNTTLNMLITSYVVYYHIYHPLIGTACELHAIIVWLKTCSYAFTNRDLRRAYLSLSWDNELPEFYRSCPYPQNISLGNLAYFWWAPTLVYQPVYPRTDRIRWLFVAKRCAEGVLLSVAIWIASAQYAAPLLQNSLEKIETLDYASILERLLKLSTISLFCWLCGFFAVFQSFLNALAEIMRFGDREFYSDWWNAGSIRKYWTSWNKPVMAFMRRHVYAPLVGRGWDPTVAQIIVFIFSGFLHELLVGIPTHNMICKYTLH